MASVQELTKVKCRQNPGHTDFIPLSKFTPSCLPKKSRSLLHWAQLHRKAIRAVKLTIMKDTSSESWGSGCITTVDDSKNNEIKLTVKTANHLKYEKNKPATHEGYEKNKPASTTVTVFVPDTDKVLKLKSGNVEVIDIDRVADIAMLSVVFERHNFKHLNIDTVVTNIRNALTPTRDTLLEYVLEIYQTVPFSLSSFLKDEISCIKNIEFALGNPDVINIHLDVEPMYIFDVILFINVFASNPEDTRMLLTKMAFGSDSKTGEGCWPVTVVSPEMFADSTVLDRVTTSLCNPLSESIVGKISDDLGYLFPFEIGVVLTESNVMTMLVGSTAGSEEVGLGTGQDVQCLGAAGRATALHRRDRVEGPQPPDVGLDDNKLKEEQIRSLPRLDVRNKTFAEIYSQLMLNTEGLSCVHLKPIQESGSIEPDPKDTLAVLISYPHAQEPQHVTIGYVKRYHEYEVFYTTPSCDGSSGGPVWLIQRKPTSSDGEFDDICSATHSAGCSKYGVGVLFEFPKN